MKKSPSIFVVLIFLSLCLACNAEKSEGIKLCKTLNSQQNQLVTLNEQELQCIASMQAWIGQISFFGVTFTRKQESQTAERYLQEVKDIKQNLTTIRQAIDGETLKVAFNQTLRTNITASLSRREQFLGELETSLGQAPSAIASVQALHVPNVVVKIKDMLQTYQKPEDSITSSIKELRNKYEIVDSELTQ